MRKSLALQVGALAAAMSVGVGIGVAVAAQVHMDAALSDLRAARAELNAALPDKGGHRITAIKLVDDAIAETKAGIDVGR